MDLKEYIKALQGILETKGNLKMFSASDPEGNSYNSVHYLPEIRYVHAGEEDSYRLEYLYQEFNPEKQTMDEYIDENCLDKEDFEEFDMRPVILL